MSQNPNHPTWSPAELVAAMALRNADRDLVRAGQRLRWALGRLPIPAGERDLEDLDEVTDDRVTRLHVAAQGGLDHLRPARRALEEALEELDRLPIEAGSDREARELATSHAAFRKLLAEISPPDLAGLRHLLTCRLCQDLARSILELQKGGEHAAGPPGRPGRSGTPGVAPGRV